MKGYQITFFTQQDRSHHHKPLAEWLMLTARELGIYGATIIAASEEETQRFFELLANEKVKLFYVKTPVEYGTIGEE